jgi:hypothetical protein
MIPLEHTCQLWARSHCEHLWDAWLGTKSMHFDVWLFKRHLEQWIEFARDTDK